MATLITEPASINPATLDWQFLLNKTTKGSGGYELLDFTDKDNNAIPFIKAGSRFELNGSLYEVTVNEQPLLFSSLYIGTCWIYAVPSNNGLSCEFQFSNDQPIFEPKRGGWAHPNINNNWRAVMIAYKKDNNSCIGKSLMREIPFFAHENQLPPNANVTDFAVIGTTALKSIWLFI